MHHIAARIETLRGQRGLSQTQLSVASAIPRMTLSRRLVDPSTFTVAELERVASALDVDPMYLVIGDAA